MLSDTLRYINLSGLVIGLVVLCGPMHLRTCVNEDRGDGEGEGSEVRSDTLRYINLTGLTIGLVVLCGPTYLCACVNEDVGTGRLWVSKRYQIHLDTSISSE